MADKKNPLYVVVHAATVYHVEVERYDPTTDTTETVFVPRQKFKGELITDLEADKARKPLADGAIRRATKKDVALLKAQQTKDQLPGNPEDTDELVEGEDLEGDEPDDEDEDVEEVPLEDLSDEEMVTFIREDKPTIKALTEEVGDDKDLAERVLKAETEAAGEAGPREGLVTALNKVIEKE